MTLSSTSANPASHVISNDHAKAKPADRAYSINRSRSVKHQPKYRRGPLPLRCFPRTRHQADPAVTHPLYGSWVTVRSAGEQPIAYAPRVGR